jgi:hypothetical protein
MASRELAARPAPYTRFEGTKVLDLSGQRDLSAEVMADHGRPRIMPAAFYSDLNVTERAIIGARNALYGLPTQELVAWLREEIGERTAIEIGAAHGALAHALGITATDSCMQDNTIIQAMYAASGQKTVVYGSDVVPLAAAEAIAHFRPQVVVACWVTHLWREDRPEAGGNAIGVDEEAVIDACETYIFIGNETVHRNKSIWSRPHRIIYPDWLYSRAHNGAREFIAVWGK